MAIPLSFPLTALHYPLSLLAASLIKEDRLERLQGQSTRPSAALSTWPSPTPAFTAPRAADVNEV